MPIIEIHLIEGYDDAAKARLAETLTDAVRSVVPAEPKAITVMMHELPAANYARGGITGTPAPALPDPVEIVTSFLAAMEARNLAKAKSYLGEGFTMEFPSTGPFTALEELIEWAKPRYRFVKKTYDGFDRSQSDDRAVIHCRGTLSGEWPDGTAFAGIRFIDRFELSNGLIVKQDVWNDMAETKAAS